MSATDDQVLLEKWRSGNVQAFGDLFERHASRLYNLAYRLAGTQEEAKDLLQTAALRAFSSASVCRNGTSFYGWMRRVVTNLYLDGRKSKSRAGRDLLDEEVDWSELEPLYVPQDPDSPRRQLEEKRTLEQLERAISDLDPIYRSLVVLRDIEGLSYAEIAEIQGIPLETVRTRLRRARTALRNALGSLFGDESL